MGPIRTLSPDSVVNEHDMSRVVIPNQQNDLYLYGLVNIILVTPGTYRRPYVPHQILLLGEVTLH